MKNLKKIILVLVLTVMVGFIPNVYAEEVDSSVMNAIPDTINVSLNEKDVIKENEYGEFYISEEVTSNIEEQVKNQLTANSVAVDDYNIYLSFIKGSSTFFGAYKCRVSIANKENPQAISEKYIKVRYNDTTDTDNAAKESIQNKLENSPTFYLMALSNEGTNSLKEQIKKYLGDTSLEIFLGGQTTATGEAPVIIGGVQTVFVYKNNQYYAAQRIPFTQVEGYRLNDGTPIAMLEIVENDNTYTEMKSALSQKGYSNIIKAYELKLVEGSINGKLSLNIPVGAEYNGKEVVILHKKSDGSYEEFTTTVKDGNASIEVTELSPFMIALKNSSNFTKLSNNAQTSSMNIVLLSILSVLSLSGIIYLVIRNKKVA